MCQFVQSGGIAHSSTRLGTRTPHPHGCPICGWTKAQFVPEVCECIRGGGYIQASLTTCRTGGTRRASRPAVLTNEGNGAHKDTAVLEGRQAVLRPTVFQRHPWMPCPAHGQKQDPSADSAVRTTMAVENESSSRTKPRESSPSRIGPKSNHPDSLGNCEGRHEALAVVNGKCWGSASRDALS